MRNYQKELFDFVDALQLLRETPIHDEAYSIYKSAFELKEIDQVKETTYRVFIKGGIQFEIIRNMIDEGAEYTFYSLWEGPFNCTTAQSILAVFLILGISIQVAGGEENQ